ncbi:hypothetical protein K402DRAFT_369481 [Aulographum hederae CBS 113979]|uniref:Ribonucleases P/MRP subunit Pop8-like domain-containing protein n=1 Tax=Aulographum hederae CBS 113979 TaxID=1176131 RepID=A0A6G1HC70_9PEZI|nr:hypothetical protein K402DRAFT_369481 [Aulographum hederae CBS 113979]
MSTNPSQTTEEPSKKRLHTAAEVLTTHTLRSPTWTYLHLTLYTSHPSSDPFQPPSTTTASASSSEDLDPLTARTHLTAALRQFLGLTGLAIPIDILKVEGCDVWIRVPREEGAAVRAAVSGWVGRGDGVGVGWKVKAYGEWLGGLRGGGEDLFG